MTIQTPSFETEVDLYSKKVWFILRRAEWKSDADYLFCDQLLKILETKYKGKQMTDGIIEALRGSFRNILEIEIQNGSLKKELDLWTWRNTHVR